MTLSWCWRRNITVWLVTSTLGKVGEGERYVFLCSTSSSTLYSVTHAQFTKNLKSFELVLLQLQSDIHSHQRRLRFENEEVKVKLIQTTLYSYRFLDPLTGAERTELEGAYLPAPLVAGSFHPPPPPSLSHIYIRIHLFSDFFSRTRTQNTKDTARATFWSCSCYSVVLKFRNLLTPKYAY